MRFLQNLPLRHKLTCTILITCGTVLLLACAVLFGFQTLTFQLNFARDLEALAHIVADNSSAALTYNDKDTARKALAALKAKPNIASAYVLASDGSRLAQFGFDQSLVEVTNRFPDGMRSVGPYRIFSCPVNLDGKRLGTVQLWSDYNSELFGLLSLYAGILPAVLMASLLLAFFLSMRFQQFISEPILKLAGTAQLIAEKNDYSVRAEKVGRDEVGKLTDAFNQMLTQIQSKDKELRSSQKELVDASRRAGMAEIATGVLHNVGNVLNSANVSVSVVHELLRNSKISTLEKVVMVLQEHKEDLGGYITKDSKGKLIPNLLYELAARLRREQTDQAKEVDSLGRAINHIKQIVAAQQSYAKVSGLLEPLDPVSVARDAIEMNSGTFGKYGIEMVEQFEQSPPVLVDKHRVMQILINLLRNAKQAIEQENGKEKRITVGVRPCGSDRVEITVRDTGIGIPPENLNLIFAHGFTTKTNGHGFGLHSCALAAKEMGGSLSVQSDGQGLGAVFVLELPVDKKRTEA